MHGCVPRYPHVVLCAWCISLGPSFSPLQLLQMETATGIAKGTITGRAVALTLVAAAAGTATISPLGADGAFGGGTIRAIAGVFVAAPVALPAFTVCGSSCRRVWCRR